MSQTVSMASDFLIPPLRFSDALEVGLVDSVPIGAHLKFLFENFDEMHPYDFYRELFPKGELDEEGVFTEGKYTAIAVRVFEEKKANGKTKVHRYTVCDDLSVLNELFKCNEFCVMAPISYAGKSQRQANARFLYAIVFDLDGLLLTDDGRSKSLINLFAHIEFGALPKPSHIVSSGTGLHLYYMLERPLPLFPNILKSLQVYRSYLIPQIWNHYISSEYEKPQFESATQGFRIVGTKNIRNGRTARAFKVGEKVSLDYMNSFADDEHKVKWEYTSITSISRAKEQWPEWYQHRIVEGKPRGTWNIKRDLYDWWKRKIQEGAAVGHRYFCVMALAIYARKCGVAYEELEADAFNLLPFLNGLDGTGESPFTSADVIKALECYDANYITFPRHTIEQLTAIPMPPNKRNGREIHQHIAMVNATRKMRRDEFGEDEYKNNGRPKGSGIKKDEIRAYAAAHPEANHSEIARALGISRPTVIKWLKN